MEEIYNIVSKKFRGETLSEVDEVNLSAWLSKNGNQKLYEDLETVWMLSGKLEYKIQPNLDQEWEHFKAIRDKRKPTKIRKINRSLLAAVASVVLLIGIVGVLSLFNTSKTLIYEAQNAEKYIELPDQTAVWLNKNSKLTVSKKFNRNSRLVELEGEAFFDVYRNEALPFIIKTQEVYSKVLGTSFNLRAYESEEVVELQVVTGKVQFGELSDNHLIVEKNYSAKYQIENNQLSAARPLNPNLISWKTKEFTFNNAKISEVIEAFERYFDKDISIPSESVDLRFSGDFTAPTAKDFAEVLAIAFNWDYKILSNKIEFKNK